MRILSTFTLILVFFYLMTAVIQGIGGPGEQLVFKPFHGFVPFYGGGGENSWKSAHPGEALPWWHYPNRDYIRLHKTSYETTVPPWFVVYALGYYLTCILVFSVAFRFLLRQRRAKAEEDVDPNA